jgi:2-aminoethylphosphonate-pyruvate transaminase
LRGSEAAPLAPSALNELLSADRTITHVAAVHCETTTGILNPIEPLGTVAKKHKKTYIVDAMSSFGGIPIAFDNCGIDFLISSANKCIEGVPGFCFVLCRRAALLACEGIARSLSLDLLGQFKGFEKNGQFRYTPPTHALLAFHQALHELAIEGGISARAQRYQENHRVLLDGLQILGLKPYLTPSVQSYIITAFHCPSDFPFVFDRFYRRLSEEGFIIYPGKLTTVDTFRIGTIGRIFPADIRQLVHAVGSIFKEMRSQPAAKS